MSRLDENDDDEAMDDSAQAGPSRSPRPSHSFSCAPAPAAGSRQALLSLRGRVTPIALRLLWSATTAAAEDDEEGSEDEERRAGLSEEEVEKWVEERMGESSSSSSGSGSDAQAQAREDVIRLGLLDCLISAALPPTQPDLAAFARNTLADLAESSASGTTAAVSSLRSRGETGGTSSAHLLVALTTSYRRRKAQSRATSLYGTEAEAETVATVKELVLAVLAPQIGPIRSTLLAWTLDKSERERWERLFAVFSGSTDGAAAPDSAAGDSLNLPETLAELCEDWQKVGGESATVLQYLRQAVRSVGGSTNPSGSLSASSAPGDGGQGSGEERNVVHPLQLGQLSETAKGDSKLGMQTQAEREVLLHALSSSSLAWHEKERLFSLFLAAHLADADSTGKSESERYSAFCTELLVAASKNLSTAVGAEKQIWRSVLLAEIPLLMSYTVDAHIAADDRPAALAGILTASFTSASFTASPELAIPTTDTQESAKTDLVSAFHDVQLIDDSQANALISGLGIENGGRLMLQLHEQSEGRGVDVPTLIAGDHLTDAGAAQDFFRRMLEEPTCAKDAGAALIECFKTSTTVATASLDALSLIVLALLEQPAALHTILLFTSASELGAPLRCIFTDEEVIDNLCGPGVGGDDESGMLSRVVLFIQWLAQLSSQSEEHGHGLDLHSRDFHFSISPSASRAYSLQDLTEEESPLVSRWISELFDSDGIGDEIIRDSPPRILIKLAPTLLHQSILAAEQGVIDVEMLKGGCSFFLQDLLSYTLPSGLVWLMRDLERIGGVHQAKATSQGAGSGTSAGTPSRASLLVTLLSMFLLDESCPALVLELVRPHFERLQSFGGGGAAIAAVGGGGGTGAQALMDTSTLEALRTRFKREEAKGLRVPELNTFTLATLEEAHAPAFNRELEPLQVRVLQSSSALRVTLQPILTKLSQQLSRSMTAHCSSREEESTTYLASTAAALLAAHFLSHSSSSDLSSQGGEDDAGAADAQAFSGVLLALDLLSLSPAGRSVDWVQPRALVLAQLLRVLAHAPGMLSSSSSDDDSGADKKRRLEERDGGEGEAEEDLFGDEDKDGDADAGASAGAGDGSSSSRFATLARLCALALLRAISLDPISSGAGVPAVLAALPADAGKTGRKGRRGVVIEKNQRAAVWSIRTVLQLLPSALASSADTSGAGSGRESPAGGTLGKRSTPGPKSGGETSRRAQRVVQDVVQGIWEVVIVP